MTKGVGEREKCVCEHQWNIARFLYTIGIPLTGSQWEKLSNPEKEGAQQKANQTNTKRLIDTVCEATLWTYRGQE